MEVLEEKVENLIKENTILKEKVEFLCKRNNNGSKITAELC